MNWYSQLAYSAAGTPPSTAATPPSTGAGASSAWATISIGCPSGAFETGSSFFISAGASSPSYYSAGAASAAGASAKPAIAVTAAFSYWWSPPFVSGLAKIVFFI